MCVGCGFACFFSISFSLSSRGRNSNQLCSIGDACSDLMTMGQEVDIRSDGSMEEEREISFLPGLRFLLVAQTHLLFNFGWFNSE